LFSPWIIRSFSNLYYEGLQGAPLYEKTTWLGVQCLKCPLDTWIFQEIIYRTKPDVIVETGVHQGGSLLFLASILDILGSGRVIGCDITLEHVSPRVRAHPRVTLIEGSSTSPEVLAFVTDQCRNARVMVTLDSCHTAEHVYAELVAYGQLVTPGCYMICEDTNVNGHPVFPSHGPGPYEAVDRFLREHRKDWEVDRSCEKLLLTYNPSGYLLRK
jgi:cephalosporin hydroxylase